MLDVERPTEAVHALSSMIDGFAAYLYAAEENGIRFEVLVDSDESITAEEIHLTFEVSFVITPVPVGSGALVRIIVGVVLIVVSIYCPPAGILGISALSIGLMGGALLLSGIAMAIAPTPKTPQEQAKREGKDSFLFNRSAKTTDQGVAVPLLYGKYRISGLAILSSAIDIQEHIEPID